MIGGSSALLVILVSIVLLGLYHRSVARVVAEVYAPVRDGLGTAAAGLGSARGRVSQSLRDKLAAVGLSGAAWSPAHIAGATINTLLFTVYLACDYVTLMLTVEALLELPGESKVPFQEHLGILIGVAVILPAVHSVWILMEMLDRSDLVAARRLSGRTRGAFAALSIVILILALSIQVFGGIFRGTAVSDPGVDTAPPPSSLYAAPASEGGASAALDEIRRQEEELSGEQVSTWERSSKLLLMVGMPVMLLLGSIVAFAFGPHYLMFLLPFGVWLAVATALALAQMGVLGLRWLLLVLLGVLLMLLAGVSRIGITVTRPLVDGCRELHRWALSERARRRSIWLSLLSALSAWAMDVETPEDGVGGRGTIDPPAQVTSPPSVEGRLEDGPERPEPLSGAPGPRVIEPEVPAATREPAAGASPEEGLDVVDLHDEIVPQNGWDPFPPVEKPDEGFAPAPAGGR
jgi:hypothetical protein